MTITINGVTHYISRDRMSYCQVVDAGLKDVPILQQRGATVSYTGAREKIPDGTLKPRNSIRIMNGTAFTVNVVPQPFRPVVRKPFTIIN